jgi:hypothetical protein
LGRKLQRDHQLCPILENFVVIEAFSVGFCISGFDGRKDDFGGVSLTVFLGAMYQFGLECQIVRLE